MKSQKKYQANESKRKTFGGIQRLRESVHFHELYTNKAPGCILAKQKKEQKKENDMGGKSNSH